MCVVVNSTIVHRPLRGAAAQNRRTPESGLPLGDVLLALVLAEPAAFVVVVEPPPGAHGFGSGCVFSALEEVPAVVVVVVVVEVAAAVEEEEEEERLAKGLAAPNPS